MQTREFSIDRFKRNPGRRPPSLLCRSPKTLVKQSPEAINKIKRHSPDGHTLTGNPEGPGGPMIPLAVCQQKKTGP